MRLGFQLLCCALVIGASPFVGEPLSGEMGDFILWQLRVPRLIVGVLVGGVLGLSGAVFQAVFRNGLATPSTVGTLAGATLGALFALLLGVGTAFGLPAVALFAFLFALGVSALVISIAGRRSRAISDVLLAGIAATLAASAISTGLQYSADSQVLFAAVKWSLGHLPQVGYSVVLWLLLPTLGASFALVRLARPLQSLVMGEELAESQGVSVVRLRVVALGAASFGVAACVAWCGPIAFVGLVVPHLVRGLGARAFRQLLPLSWLYGATLLVACDTLARLILPGRELPVGVITAGLGAPALLWIISRRK